MTGAARRTPSALRTPPALRADLLVSEVVWHGPRPVRLVRDPRSRRTHELGVREHFLLSRLDGTRTLGSIGADYSTVFGRRVDPAGWHDLLVAARRRGLLVGSADDPPRARPPRLRGSLLAGELAVVRDGQHLGDRLLRPVLAVSRASRAVRRLLGAVGAIAALVTVVAVLLAVADADRVVQTAVAGLDDPVVLLAVAAVIWASAAAHEVAHALVARAYGGTVRELGISWRLPLVVPFCRVEDYRYLPSRAAAWATAGAGCAANLLLLVVLAAWWLGAHPAGRAGTVVAAALVLETVLVLANLLPVPPLDGYVLLSLATATVGLAPASRSYLRLALRARFARAPVARAQLRARRDVYPRRLRRLYAGYAVALPLLAVVCMVVLVAALVASEALS